MHDFATSSVGGRKRIFITNCSCNQQKNTLKSGLFAKSPPQALCRRGTAMEGEQTNNTTGRRVRQRGEPSKTSTVHGALTMVHFGSLVKSAQSLCCKMWG